MFGFLNSRETLAEMGDLGLGLPRALLTAVAASSPKPVSSRGQT